MEVVLLVRNFLYVELLLSNSNKIVKNEMKKKGKRKDSDNSLDPISL